MRGIYWLIGVVLLWTSPANARYQETMSGCFNTVTACGFTFPAVSQETLVLHVSCLVDLQKVIDPSLVFPVILSTSGPTATPTASNWLRAANMGISPAFDGSGWYGVNAETYLFFAPGQTPIVTLIVPTTIFGASQCTISGE
jgi:hypothetical protein